MLDHIPDFGLGETYRGVDDNGNDINTALDGRVCTFPITTAVANALSMDKRVVGRRVEAMVCRNKTGGVLLPGEIGSTTATNGIAGMAQIDAKSSADDRLCYIVDPALPAAGVADDELFFGIIGGPSKIKQPASAVSVTAGDLIKAGASGRLAAGVQTAGDTQLQIGTALETNNTNDDLVDLIVHPNWV